MCLSVFIVRCDIIIDLYELRRMCLACVVTVVVVVSVVVVVVCLCCCSVVVMYVFRFGYVCSVIIMRFFSMCLHVCSDLCLC